MPRFKVILLFLAVTFLPGNLSADVGELFRAKAESDIAAFQVAAISARFLGTQYQADTIGGGPEQTEALTAKLDGVDCFTLLDYVEAVRRSASPAEFLPKLQEVRYHGSIVSWQTRKHFFSDWAEDSLISDVTPVVGRDVVVGVEKALNRKNTGELYLPGVTSRQRTITYIPTNALDQRIHSRMQTGDYHGIYSGQAGLDVSHVGILIKRDDNLFLRHASNRPGVHRVVDSALMEYLQDKPGVIVLRARPL